MGGVRGEAEERRRQCRRTTVHEKGDGCCPIVRYEHSREGRGTLFFFFGLITNNQN
jgi:hypothetical protein